jgi:hypothetical protein
VGFTPCLQSIPRSRILTLTKSQPLILASTYRFPWPEYFFIFEAVLMAIAFNRGMRGWEEDRESRPWLAHAWGKGALVWLLLFTISLDLLANVLLMRKIIPFSPWHRLGTGALEWFQAGLFVISILCAAFCRLLAVGLGFRWRQAQG